MARYPQPTQQGQCNRVYYTSGNSVINVANTQVTNQVLFTQEGTAVPISTDGSALWNVTLNLSSGEYYCNVSVTNVISSLVLIHFLKRGKRKTVMLIGHNCLKFS